MISLILRTTHKSELPAAKPEASRYSCALVSGILGGLSVAGGRWLAQDQGRGNRDSNCTDRGGAARGAHQGTQDHGYVAKGHVAKASPEPSSPTSFALPNRLASEAFIP